MATAAGRASVERINVTPVRGLAEATILVEGPTPRCALPSYDPDTAGHDRDVLRELLAVRGPIDGQLCLGVFAEVLEPGTVRVGDAIALS